MPIKKQWKIFWISFSTKPKILELKDMLFIKLFSMFCSSSCHTWLSWVSLDLNSIIKKKEITSKASPLIVCWFRWPQIALCFLSRVFKWNKVESLTTSEMISTIFSILQCFLFTRPTSFWGLPTRSQCLSEVLQIWKILKLLPFLWLLYVSTFWF